MKKKVLILVMILGLALGLATTSLAGGRYSDILLPNDINIVSPTPDLPKELVAFSGKWAGTWFGGGADAILIVEKIDEKEAQVIYAWKFSSGRSGSLRITAKVTPGKQPALEFEGRTIYLYFQMNGDLESLKGKWSDVRWRGKRLGHYETDGIIRKRKQQRAGLDSRLFYFPITGV